MQPAADMLPRGVREKLLQIAQHIKQKHKAAAEEAAAREGSSRRGMLSGLTKKSLPGSHPHVQ